MTQEQELRAKALEITLGMLALLPAKERAEAITPEKSGVSDVLYISESTLLIDRSQEILNYLQTGAALKKSR
jgi:hypothetical protein